MQTLVPPPDAVPHPDPAGSDADLLGRFLTDRSEAAFAELVRRHGPLVLRACRRVLGGGPDADDCFQATFLVLAERAATVRDRASVGSWLFGVADRVARKARRRLGRTTPPPATEPPAMTPDPADAAGRTEVLAAVDEELARLPGKYRDPLVLCYLDGLTTAEAAGRARCPEGTFKSRLSKARDLLRGRLLRRGVALSAAGLTAAVAGPARAGVPAPLADTAARQAVALAAGRPVSPVPARLAGEVASELRRLPWAGPAVVAAVLLVVGGLFWAAGGRPAGDGGTPAEEPRPAEGANPGAGKAGTLVVVNQKDSTVSLVDLRTNKAKTIKTGAGPHEAAVSPNGRRAAVSNYGPPAAPKHGNTVTVIALPRGEVETTLDLGGYAAPHGLAWLDDDRLLCTCEASEAVVVANAATGKVERAIKTDQPVSHMVAFVPGGKRAFTANITAGTVSVLDVPGGKKVRDLELAKGIEGIGLRPDGKQVWVLNRATNEAAVIDAGTLAVEKTLPAPKLPFRVAFTPDGSTALVACPVAGELAVFDTAPPRERKRVAFAGGAVKFNTPGPPPGPLAVAVRPDGKVAYATVHVANAVAVIDLEKMVVTGKIPVGGGPDGIAYSPLDLDPAPKEE